MLAKRSITQEHGSKRVLGNLGLTGEFGLLALLKLSTFITKWKVYSSCFIRDVYLMTHFLLGRGHICY
jgi:hypothetical protein